MVVTEIRNGCRNAKILEKNHLARVPLRGEVPRTFEYAVLPAHESWLAFNHSRYYDESICSPLLACHKRTFTHRLGDRRAAGGGE